MFTVDDKATGPRGASRDHERLVLQARDVEFDWAALPFYYVPGEPFATSPNGTRGSITGASTATEV